MTVRVLLVDDDAVDRLACRRALGAQSDYTFEVEEADTARAGLGRVQAVPPDLILLDYHLPDMDGVEFLAELAAGAGEVDIPVVMLTGAQDIAIAVDAMRRGARDYLVKDGEGDYLKLLPTVIHRVLRESRAHADKRAAEAQLRAAEAWHRRHLEEQVAERTEQIEKQKDLLSEANSKLVREIEERREAEARFRLLLESAGEGIYGLDMEGRCTFINEAALAMLGYTREELLGRETHSLIHHTDADGRAYPEPECRIYDAFRTGQASRGLVELLWRKDGSSFLAEYSAQPLHEAGRLTGAVLVFRDVTEAQELRHLLSYQATHDALTGLLNRQEFERRMARLFSEPRDEGEEHALLYLDLDRFKVVNDTCGHSAGDQLLRQITERLQERLRSRDTLARLGGDEFGVLLEHCPLDQALRIATELRDAAQDYRFVWEGKPFSVGASIGLVPLSAASGGVSEALAAADAACYAAKEQGRNRVHLYQPDDAMLAQQKTQMQWVSRLTHALDANRFRLYQQVIAPLGRHGQNRPHHEILLRLLDETGRVVEPMAFVPAAERYNLMPAIDRWVVREVIRHHAVQQRLAPAAERPIFAVNLSGSSLADERMAEFVQNLLIEHGVPADMLCFEISETAAIANLNHAMKFIQTLRQTGCLFALDNFGSGMSSFAYLKQLPVDFLKIDGSFIRTIVEDHVTRAMAEAINRVAHVMAIETVAECTETGPVLALLQELGVDHAQGYALARPQPLPEAETYTPDGPARNSDAACVPSGARIPG